MPRLTENKIVLVVRETRLEELKARFNTVEQARFYIEQQGASFADYEDEDRAYKAAVAEAERTVSTIGRVQTVHRAFLPNFLFGPDDLVVAVGQDGLVANTVKYLDGQAIIGVNPDPSRYDGLLLPFTVKDLGKVVVEAFQSKRPLKSVTMAKAKLNNGQILYAVNDFFVGPKSHGSARYTLVHGERNERHSSSGIIVSTGLGSTGWFTSLISGARAIAAAFPNPAKEEEIANTPIGFPSDAEELRFTVREPFPSKVTGIKLVYGKITKKVPLVVESHMAERGVGFPGYFGHAPSVLYCC